jgi:hypothetical protein
MVGSCARSASFVRSGTKSFSRRASMMSSSGEKPWAAAVFSMEIEREAGRGREDDPSRPCHGPLLEEVRVEGGVEPCLDQRRSTGFDAHDRRRLVELGLGHRVPVLPVPEDRAQPVRDPSEDLLEAGRRIELAGDERETLDGDGTARSNWMDADSWMTVPPASVAIWWEGTYAPPCRSRPPCPRSSRGSTSASRWAG